MVQRSLDQRMESVVGLNHALEEIWREYVRLGSGLLAPMSYLLPEPGALLFVGMNPSFSSQGWHSILRRGQIENLDPESFFSWPRNDDYDEEVAEHLELLARQHYPFFSPHRQLSKELALPWGHIDLFCIREKDQGKAKDLVLSGPGDGQLSRFGEAQFSLFEKAVSLAAPSAVIITNALASSIYRNKRPLEFDCASGIYQDRIDGKTVPVFLSGMLTGARALDRHSRDRLFWQIAKFFGKTWQPNL